MDSRGSGEIFFKFATGRSDVIGVENGGNDADALSAGGEDFVHSVEVDPSDGEPGDLHIGCGPPDVIECDRFGAGFCAGGENRTDGNVISTCGDCFLGLFRGVSAESDLYPAADRNVRAPKFI